MSSATTTSRIAMPLLSALAAAHRISAQTTSSRSSGVLSMASQVRCTCRREKAL
ncbi:Uncharacterised protein [Bordetella pertussis]|nr:Uncharacterised protein [Bordetella pertussis]